MMTREDWTEECAFIAEQAIAFMPGKFGATEFADKGEFLRYCHMQSCAVQRAGFTDLAMRIQRTVDTITP